MNQHAPTFDLQAHSTHSDGVLPPEAVVALAAEAGVELLALTDHDTVDGIDRALSAGEEHGVDVIPAVELSTVDEGQDLHVLGYGIDHRHPELTEELEAFREDRVLRAEQMGTRLVELGLEVDEAALERRRAAGKPVGRPHVAEAVLSSPANADRLREEGIADVSALIRGYLIPGKPGFLPRTRPTVPEAIQLVHTAGGLAVWAHPFWDVSEVDKVLAMIDRFVQDGLDGVEVFYTTHTREETTVLADYCEERGLAMTGSADFHGPDHKIFSEFRAFELHGASPTLDRLPR